MENLNPQAEQMADESMVRNLRAQAEAIWPQEAGLFSRYQVGDCPRILDAGCGTGEASIRLAELYPKGTVIGVDILDEHLSLARARSGSLAPRVTFEHASIYELPFGKGSFDLVVCRHVVHSIPHADRVIAELARVTKAGGYLHVIAEDYGMLHFQDGPLNTRTFWCEGPAQFGAATGTDLYVGRNTFAVLAALRLEDIKIDYVVVDPLRVPRETFAQILDAWRDGYATSIGELPTFSSDQARALFDQMTSTLRNPEGYGVWMVPVFSARIPAGTQ
jgi:ubiquinone/menaquinone biosynthesis C-methylase UbiE